MVTGDILRFNLWIPRSRKLVTLRALKDEMEAIDIAHELHGSGAPDFFYTVLEMQAAKEIATGVLQGLIDGL